MGSITIPTSELLGGINDVLPFILDPKNSSLAGFVLAWNGESLSFTTYDVRSGACSTWFPGEGDESDLEKGPDGEAFDDETVWGGEADPFRVFVSYADAKEIIKVFKLPAKLWRTPVVLKVNVSQTKLTVERNDTARGERLLVLATDAYAERNVPDFEVIRLQATEPDRQFIALGYSPARLGAVAGVRAHGVMGIDPYATNEPTLISMGIRFSAFVYREGAKVAPYSVLRHGSGLVTS